MSKTNKLVPCCADPDCEILRELLEFFRLWGIDQTLKRDRAGAYFDVTPPEFWGEHRRGRFQEALTRLKLEH